MSILQLMRVPADGRDLEWLREALQSAIALEHSTIPPYLCALWSIKRQNVSQTTKIIWNWVSEIVLEEMLHMGLACNLLTAIGGRPNIYCAGFVPNFPTALPGNVHPGLIVSLAGLAKDDAADPVKRKEVVQTFMQIEYPENPVALDLRSGRDYSTIGEFYDAISNAFSGLCPAISLRRQLTESRLGLTTIATLKEVADAITLIKTQGEGTAQSPLEGQDGTGDVLDDGKLAHYYKFAQIYYERRIQKDPNAPQKWSFSGDPVPFPAEDELFLMGEVPPGGYCESIELDAIYTSILRRLHFAWSDGDQTKLDAAINEMDTLGAAALDLLNRGLNVSSGKGIKGPSFTFRP